MGLCTCQHTQKPGLETGLGGEAVGGHHHKAVAPTGVLEDWACEGLGCSTSSWPESWSQGGATHPAASTGMCIGCRQCCTKPDPALAETHDSQI